MRDDFPEETKRTIAQRVNYICSRCEALTAGPRIDGSKALNVGVAAHITSASPGGPRYDKSLTPEERRHADNGVWLCQTCGKLLDNDEARFTKETLREWKERAEGRALESIGKTGGPHRKVRLQARVGVLVPHVELLVGEGNRIYKEIIGDPVQLQHLADYQLRIEQWRTRVGNFCDQELPGSGARTLALPKDGQLGVGPIGFELTRLVSALNGLKEIIHSIESYVSRSQPLEQPPTAGDSKGQRRVAITTLLKRATDLRQWVQDGDPRSEVAAENLYQDAVNIVRQHCMEHEMAYLNTCQPQSGVEARARCYEERLTYILNRI